MYIFLLLDMGLPFTLYRRIRSEHNAVKHLKNNFQGCEMSDVCFLFYFYFKGKKENFCYFNVNK